MPCSGLAMFCIPYLRPLYAVQSYDPWNSLLTFMRPGTNTLSCFMRTSQEAFWIEGSTVCQGSNKRIQSASLSPGPVGQSSFGRYGPENATLLFPGKNAGTVVVTVSILWSLERVCMQKICQFCTPTFESICCKVVCRVALLNPLLPRILKLVANLWQDGLHLLANAHPTPI